MKTNSKASTLSLYIYQRLLSLYPNAFRDRFGSELIQTYIDVFNQAQESEETFSLFSLWFWLLPDLCSSILNERFQEWRNEMKSKWSLAKGFGVFFLVLWFSFWALSLGRNLFHLPIADPTYWILGEQFSNLKLILFNICILFIPFVIMLAYLIPSIKITTVSGSDNMMQVRVMRMSKLSVLVISICGIVSILFWGAILFSRLGLL
jgi:hypothetical protein